MSRFLQTLTGNLVFLSAVMPLVGIFLVAAFHSSGAAGIRRTACTNAALTLVLAFAVLWLYPASPGKTGPRAERDSPPVFQMVTARSLPFLPEPASSSGRWQLVLPGLLVGVDGASAILMCLFCGLMLAAVLAAESEHDRHPGLLYGSLLLWQSLQMLSLLSLDFRLSVLTGAASLPVLFLLAGLWGGRERRRTAVILTAVLAAAVALEAGAAMLLLDATIPLVGEIPGTVRASSALLPERIDLLLSRNAAAEQWWFQVSSLAFPLVLASLVLRLGLAPVHGWFVSVFRQLPCFLKIMLPGWLLASGLTLCLRLLPLCHHHLSTAAAGLMWAGVFSSGFVMLRAAGSSMIVDRASLLLPAAGGLLVVALASPSDNGLQTAVLLAVVAGLLQAVANGQNQSESLRASRERSAAPAPRPLEAAGSWWPGTGLRTVLVGAAGLAVGIPLVTGAAFAPAELLNPGRPPFWLAVLWLMYLIVMARLPAGLRGMNSTPASRLAPVLPALLLTAVLAAPSRLTSRMVATSARFQQLTTASLTLHNQKPVTRREAAGTAEEPRHVLHLRTASAE